MFWRGPRRAAPEAPASPYEGIREPTLVSCEGFEAAGPAAGAPSLGAFKRARKCRTSPATSTTRRAGSSRAPYEKGRVAWDGDGAQVAAEARPQAVAPPAAAVDGGAPACGRRGRQRARSFFLDEPNLLDNLEPGRRRRVTRHRHALLALNPHKRLPELYTEEAMERVQRARARRAAAARRRNRRPRAAHAHLRGARPVDRRVGRVGRRQDRARAARRDVPGAPPRAARAARWPTR